MRVFIKLASGEVPQALRNACAASAHQCSTLGEQLPSAEDIVLSDDPDVVALAQAGGFRAYQLVKPEELNAAKFNHAISQAR